MAEKKVSTALSQEAEVGVIEAQGPWNVPRLLAGMEEADLPDPVPGLIRLLASQLEEVELRIDEIDTQINAWHKASPVSQRLAGVPGIGPLAFQSSRWSQKRGPLLTADDAATAAYARRTSFTPTPPLNDPRLLVELNPINVKHRRNYLHRLR